MTVEYDYDEETNHFIDTKRARHIVAVYELNRHFGGREEGGWWYNSGTRERVVKICRTEADAYAYSTRYNHLLRFFQKRNVHLRDLYSVLYNGGYFQAEVYREDKLPTYYPEMRPHYE